ncbi:hypothetical protein BK025_03515 [Sodalis sp. TME1]|nr:hypothetical protein BK025_03515 [Sodalis sp. TME1]
MISCALTRWLNVACVDALFSFSGGALIFPPFCVPPIPGLNLALASVLSLRQRFRADLDSALIC